MHSSQVDKLRENIFFYLFLFFKIVRSDRIVALAMSLMFKRCEFFDSEFDEKTRKAPTSKLNLFDFKLTDQSKSIDSGCFSSPIEKEEKNDDEEERDRSIQKLDINSIGNDTNFLHS